jgi:glutathione-regulated potassium-efflux system ancillary protein KefG
MQNRILVIFAHPRFERSVNNAIILKNIRDIPGITIHDLYERYPDFNIDIEYEKKLLTDHQVIIWQHPLYWYSAPPLLKQWIDLVLGFGWAYGPGGDALSGKMVFNSITSGGPQSAYSKEGYNRFTIRELLAPFEQTAILCKMIYLPPFAIHGTHRMTEDELVKSSFQYREILLQLIKGEFSLESIIKYKYLNEWTGTELSKSSKQ